MVLRKDVGAKGRRQKNHEVGNLHTRFRGSLSPVADLICLAVSQSHERWQIWHKHSSGVRARIQGCKFSGGEERAGRHRYHGGQ